MNNALQIREIPVGWMVDFRLPIVSFYYYNPAGDGIEAWCKENLSGKFDIRWDSLAFELESDAMLCYLNFA